MKLFHKITPFIFRYIIFLSVGKITIYGAQKYIFDLQTKTLISTDIVYQYN